MKHSDIVSPVEWARRVNQSWLVRCELNDHTEAWLDHLAALDDGRLLKSCEIARKLCAERNEDDDPKLWFYAGIYQLATAAEAERFLESHHITKATVPAIMHKEENLAWINQLGKETLELFSRLRLALAKVNPTAFSD
jgi:hypothetical protein